MGQKKGQDAPRCPFPFPKFVANRAFLTEKSEARYAPCWGVAKR
jgi:hypothetical protein